MIYLVGADGIVITCIPGDESAEYIAGVVKEQIDHHLKSLKPIKNTRMN